MKTRKQPQNKILRVLKYVWIQEQRRQFKEERCYKQGILICEVCGRTEEQVSICHSCNRCIDPKCNGGCMFCRKEKPREHCRCCGHEI